MGNFKNGIRVISIQDFIDKKEKISILISVGPDHVWDVLNTLHRYGLNEFCTLGSLMQCLKEKRQQYNCVFQEERKHII